MSSAAARPARLPERPHFSSGPCVKRPGWSAEALGAAILGRSHRGSAAKARIAEVIDRSKALLGLPADWHLGIVPGSDTGALEMALWSLLGPRGVDVLAWDSFGKDWAGDVTTQLDLADTRVLDADYGELPSLADVDFERDVVFTWNGTTAGVRIPDAEWIREDRAGLAICDATSAVFAMEIDWSRLDVATWSWQKVLGGEAAHGMLALSPRAVERLESHTPSWPMPKVFRLTKQGKLNGSIFEGATINTPSMLCVEDALDGLRWAESIGGLPALIARSQANLSALDAWVEKRDWVEFLARAPLTRSSTSMCLALCDPAFAALPAAEQAQLEKALVKLLEAEDAAYDIGSYRDAPTGLRIWGGATVETSDIQALLPWLDWAWGELSPRSR